MIDTYDYELLEKLHIYVFAYTYKYIKIAPALILYQKLKFFVS